MRPAQLTPFGGVAVVAAQAVGDQDSGEGSQQLPSGDFAPMPRLRGGLGLSPPTAYRQPMPSTAAR